MGYIKEPKGVDFIIQSEPLSEEERKKISDYIIQYKENNNNKAIPKKRLKNKKAIVKG